MNRYIDNLTITSRTSRNVTVARRTRMMIFYGGADFIYVTADILYDCLSLKYVLLTLVTQ